MYVVFKKEFLGFLNSAVAYITIGIFLVACGLLLWVFPETSILEYGYAELNGFFELIPYLFMFIVPAITMRSFAEERKEGTFVLLATKPLSDLQIILGKYFASLLLVLFALLPTLVYYYSIYQLGFPKGNIDTGGVIGSYIGLFLLAAVFAAIGIFSSSITKNQIVAFTVSVFLCFIFYSGFQSLGVLLDNSVFGSFFQYLGISDHYQSISRGVLDTRDLIYFLSTSIFFIVLTKFVLGGRKW